MSPAQEPGLANETLARPDVLLRVPLGLSSPLWSLFAGAAFGGATWWWMTRWARTENLEAMFGAASIARPAIEPTVAALEAPVAAAIDAAAQSAEAAPEPEVAASEPILETPPEPELAAAGLVGAPEPATEVAPEPDLEPASIVEALAEPVLPPEPVGGEAAPVSRVAAVTEAAVESGPAPKPRLKKVEPNAD